MTSLSRRIGQLNFTGRLNDQLRFEEVIAPLSEVDEDSALNILRDLERQGSRVPNPTAYVIAAVKRQSKDTRQSKLRDSRAVARREDIDPSCNQDTRQSQLCDSRAVARREDIDPSGKLGKQIASLNKYAKLQEQISYDEVIEPLSLLDETSAMKILKDVEGAASNIRNPVAYILKAASKASHRRREQPRIDEAEDSAVEKIKKTVGWLNNRLLGVEKISYCDVVGPLSAIDSSTAMKILKDLEGRHATITNPTGYVLRAVSNAEGRQPSDAGDTSAAPNVNRREQRGIEEAEDSAVDKIKRTVGWLNKHVLRAEKISYSDVVGPLSVLDSATAMKILNGLQGKHDTISNLTGYVVKAAYNAGSMQASDASDAGDITAGPDADRRQLDPSGRIGRTVDWLNRKAGLQQPLSLADVVEPLSALEEHAAMKILRDVGDRVETIRHPTGYVLKAASKAADWAVTSKTLGSTKHPAKRRVDLDPSGKIEKQVHWINKHKELREPLCFDDVIEPLSALDISTALDILADLEDRADEVHKPTAYVCKAAKNTLVRDSPAPATKRKLQTTPSADSVTDSKEITRMVGLLNKTADWSSKLSYSDVKAPLERCGVEEALNILEDLKFARNVRNPTAYVISAARKFIASEDDGARAKRAKQRDD